jgi:ABC-type uncharacterized transport system permease subunit
MRGIGVDSNVALHRSELRPTAAIRESTTLLYLITALLYAGLALHAFAGGRFAAGGTATVPNLPSAPADASPAVRNIAVAVALALHALSLYRGIFTDAGFVLGLGYAISLIVWLALLIYWVANFSLRIGALSTLLLPVAALAALLPLVLPHGRVLPYSGMTSFHAHLLLSIFAYSLLTIGALHALMMAAIEKALQGSPPAWLKDMPPLVPMERLLFQMLGVGFAALTLSLASGILFSEAWFGKPFQFTHKIVFGVLSWLVFAALLIGRWRYGWRGRKAVRWTLIGFALLLLAYVGSRFVLEVILKRA